MKRRLTFRRPHFLLAFVLIVAALGIAKCVNPDLTLPRWLSSGADGSDGTERLGSVERHALEVDSILLTKRPRPALPAPGGGPARNLARGIEDYDREFNDMNDVQIATASRLGIAQIADREEARERRDRLVYIGDSPFYVVQRLSHSIPYLVPRAATLLHEIGRDFNDSLAVRGCPPAKLIVTSVTRTRHDVERLRKVNANASENSCHQYGTTFDITYNRAVEIGPDGTGSVRWDGVYKAVLGEVLRDLRDKGVCYVRFETRQACFHITAR